MKDPTSPLSRGLTSFSLTFPGVIIVFGKDSPGREKEIGESRDSLSLAHGIWVSETREETCRRTWRHGKWVYERNEKRAVLPLSLFLSFVSSWTRLQEEPSAGKRNERQKGKVTERSEGRDEWVYERLRLVGSLSRPWCRLGRREKEETQPTLSFPILWTKIMDGEWRVAQAFLRL